MTMQVSFERIDITPALPVRLSGFGKVAGPKRRTIHCLPAYFYSAGSSETLWIQLDWCAADSMIFDSGADLTEFISAFIISATHTHSGPCGTVRCVQGILKGLEPVFGDVNACYIAENCPPDCKGC